MLKYIVVDNTKINEIALVFVANVNQKKLVVSSLVLFFIGIFQMMFIFLNIFNNLEKANSIIYAIVICLGTFALASITTYLYTISLLSKFVNIKPYSLAAKNKLINDLLKSNSQMDKMEFLNYNLKISRVEFTMNFLGLIISIIACIFLKVFLENIFIIACFAILLIDAWFGVPVYCRQGFQRYLALYNLESNQEIQLESNQEIPLDKNINHNDDFFNENMIKEIIKRKRTLSIFPINYQFDDL